MNLSMDISGNASTFESYELSNRGIGTDVLHCNLRRFQNAIMGSGQMFPNASTFRDVVYLMSLSGRFQYYYYYKRNSYKHNYYLHDQWLPLEK